MKNTCLLCKSQNVEIIEEISVSDLVGLYKKKFGIDSAEEFKSVDKIFYNHCTNCNLKFFTPLTPGSEKFYEQLQKFDWYYMDEKPEYTIAKKYIRTSDSVLDVGCGKGAFKKVISASDYTGLELSNAAVEIGKANNVTILNQTIETHSQEAKNKYSVVCSFQVLEHVPQIYDFLKHSIDCLAPGGLLILSVPSEDSFISALHNHVMNMPPHHISRWADSTLKKIGEIFNLQFVSIEHDNTLNDNFKFLYTTALVRNRIYGNKSEKLIDRSLKAFLIDKVSKVGGLILKKGLSEKMLPFGHSVTIIFRK